jgi:hypothetical protein
MPSTQPKPRTEPMPVSSHSLPTLSVAPAAPVARWPPHSASASAPPWLLLRRASLPAIAAAAARRLCRHAGANRFELQLAPFTARTSARVTVKVRAVVAPPHACSRAASRMRISLRRSGWPLRCVVTSGELPALPRRRWRRYLPCCMRYCAGPGAERRRRGCAERKGRGRDSGRRRLGRRRGCVQRRRGRELHP